MNLLESLEAIERASLGNERLEVLRKADSPQLRYVLTQALSSQITFGIKKLPKPNEDEFSFEDDNEWLNKLTILLSLLENRKLTGNAAQEEVAIFLGTCNDIQLKWSERIIKQDLRLNIGTKEVNNIFGPGTIFQFTVPLASPTVDREGAWTVTEDSLKGRWCVEPKLDGARCVAFLPANKGTVKLYSRTGKEWFNFEPVREKLQQINDLRNPTKSLVLDGEIISLVDDKIDFQALQHNLFRKDGKETGKLKYLLFDATFEEDWKNPKSSYAERYDFTKKFVQDSLNDVPGAVLRLGFVKMFVVNDPTLKQVVKYNLDFANEGFEGAMLRRADKPVQLKRSKDLLKVKTFQDDEALVIGANPGTGKREGVLGSLICKTEGGKIFEIGSGLNDEQLKEYWSLYKQEKLPKYVTYKFQPPLTNDQIPRFPIFKGFRSKDDF